MSEEDAKARAADGGLVRLEPVVGESGFERDQGWLVEVCVRESAIIEWRRQGNGRTIRNDRHRTPSSSRTRQLRVKSPRRLSSFRLDRLERRVSHSERDEVAMVLVDEAFEHGDLRRTSHVRVAEAATGFVRDGLDRLEDGVDEVGLLQTKETISPARRGRRRKVEPGAFGVRRPRRESWYREAP